ncbi:hypothetical protein F0562_034341 [Nyssa sinensis]|uniref:Uncharacterized protein n=1 Tax=Nyssa sinensis TaxID=561372 RepID=A0A5J5AIX2_9ASTE|nr:hypothetical protein F0562_034341 [Nyssa sinensis]
MTLKSLLVRLRSVLELPLGDVLELGLFRIPIGIPFGSCEYSPGYSPNKEGSPRVLLKRKIFGADGRMREVMVIVHPEVTPPSSTISIVDCFLGFVPHLTGVTKKHATQGSDDSKGKKISTKRVPQPSVAPRLPTRVVDHEPKSNPFTLLLDFTLVSLWPHVGNWHF